jgi:uncharacterized protein YjbJ (UPF0337 family)
MKKLMTVLAIACAAAATISFAGTSERMDAAGSKMKGTVQDTVGAATGDTELQAKGKMNKASGDLKNAKEDVKDNIKAKLN